VFISNENTVQPKQKYLVQYFFSDLVLRRSEKSVREIWRNQIRNLVLRDKFFGYTSKIIVPPVHLSGAAMRRV
jgi:hypothetical protein